MKGACAMDVVKFVRFENKGDLIYLYFKLCDSLADFVRNNTCYGERSLCMYLDDDNQYRYIISCFEEFEKIKDRLIENIEKISNEKDDEYFYNHIITDNGSNLFSAVQKCMHIKRSE